MPRRTPRKRKVSVASVPETRNTISKAMSGIIPENNKYATVIASGKILGEGCSSVVVSDPNDVTKAYKIFTRHPKTMLEEIRFQQLAACVDAAPEFYGMDGNVMQMERLTMLPSSAIPSAKQQREIIALVAKMVTIGLIHNHLHLRNVGMRADGTMVLFDFELTQELETSLITKEIFLQMVMGQLYGFIDPCDPNNAINENMCGSPKSELINCITDIRHVANADHKNYWIPELIRIREDTAAKFNSHSCDTIVFD